MGDRSWLELNFREGDGEKVYEILGEPEDETAENGKTYAFMGAESGPAQDELEELTKAGVPFTGAHGACQGAFPGYKFAAVEGKYEEWSTDDSGNPSFCVDYETGEILGEQVESFRKFAAHYRAAEAALKVPAVAPVDLPATAAEVHV